jgi:hypothetical protein
MPTSLLRNSFADFSFNTLIHPQNPATNLMPPNPKLTQANCKFLRQQPATTSFK